MHSWVASGRSGNEADKEKGHSSLGVNAGERHIRSRRWSCVVGGGDTWAGAFEIDGLDGAFGFADVAEEIAKVFPGDLAFGTEGLRVVAALHELLDAALEADSEGVGGEAEDFPDFGAEALGVDVRVFKLL